uniref:Uncharacterized protein n=1 Tax=Timema cristinae TaxID=61476 RepID=A0A7R9DBR6_TIMCR|nr:unnamed protein product [Timema cristinae]
MRSVADILRRNITSLQKKSLTSLKTGYSSFLTSSAALRIEVGTLVGLADPVNLFGALSPGAACNDVTREPETKSVSRRTTPTIHGGRRVTKMATSESTEEQNATKEMTSLPTDKTYMAVAPPRYPDRGSHNIAPEMCELVTKSGPFGSDIEIYIL